MRGGPFHRILVAGLMAIALLALGATAADGRMRSEKLGKNLCETTGGGKFVPIPGFPGEKIDRRLLDDVAYLVDRYKIFINDGFSRDSVHALNGEHPLGLALDIGPDKANGGSWKKISKLAERAEPRQNRPIAPFRWVGYDGDSGHGRGHHLHLSWNHSETRPFHPAKTVYTLRCPGSGAGGDGGGGGDTGGGRGDGGGGGGGVRPGGGKGGGGGGISPRLLDRFEAWAADPVVETGGADLP